MIFNFLIENFLYQQNTE